jgi:hypothetical protein
MTYKDYPTDDYNIILPIFAEYSMFSVLYFVCYKLLQITIELALLFFISPAIGLSMIQDNGKKFLS